MNQATSGLPTIQKTRLASITKLLAATSILAAGIGVALFSYLFTTAVYRAPFQPGRNWQMIGAEFVFLGLLISGGLIVLFTLMLVLNVGRILPAAGLLSSAVICGVTVYSIGSGVSTRTSAFEELTVRMQPVVRAIEQCQEETGTVPGTLGDLVPEYLPELPPNIPAFYLMDDRNHYQGNEWTLEALVSTGMLNFDTFVYLPAQNYSAFARYEQVGDWGYFYE